MSFFQSFLKNIIVFIVGGVFFATGAYFIEDDIVHRMKDVKTVGYVTEVKTSRGSKGKTMYRSHVRFTDRAGVAHEFDDPMRSSPQTQFKGDQIAVLYNPAQPDDARIDSLWRTYGFFGLFAGIGAATLILGCVRVARRQG